MNDPRIDNLASILIDYSVELKTGENILIEVSGLEIPLAKAIARKVYEAGGVPYISITNHTLQREILKGLSVEQAQNMARWDLARMKDMQAYIGIRAGENVNELADVPSEQMKIYMSHYSQPVHSEQRVKHTRWCVMRYPNPSMAQLAEMSTEAFEDLYFQVCNLDYSKMSKAMDPLKELMAKTDRVKIIGPGTDLAFSIKGMPAIKCDGKMNLPDGEIFTAPVIDSVNGKLTYNTPAVYQGYTFENISLTFENGKIIQAAANNTEKINKILDTDQGARFIGEFALGVNPFVLKPMKDTLFDEKIDGSFHFTPGAAYEECDNGNQSAIHWDLVCIQRPEYGGGEIYFDDLLVRKDGRFVLPELEVLNPENLK
ncbi:peptidase M29 aminopeptidase II [Syntrophobotulus glycolicus DSM 8271]|uniref:Peptidase M29 aminopeptidase II n=1 Tax=Syntrophobotulus glycolicus (strain DSM 8271 / FlGlyR) TaxID=645991 RepID=F0SYZ0_SYNGF|nr:aminopeptidase [Syntrophobotulus glycolicus]ADY56027.1 peptidase M29 aminopeptidase II [Syntrophobotulus glycolicus DSM 8271]